MKKQLSVVFPVHNNESTLVPALKQIMAEVTRLTASYELVIIDDASSDRSPQLLRQFAATRPTIRAMYHRINQGIAATYKELYASAVGQTVILFSVDGEWDAGDIVRLATAAKDADIVIGRREQKAYRLGRKVVSFLYNCVGPVFFGVQTYDAGSIKAIKKAVITHVPVRSQSVFDEAERIIKARKMGYTVTSIPVSHKSSKKLKRFMPKRELVLQALSDLVKMIVRST